MRVPFMVWYKSGMTILREWPKQNLCKESEEKKDYINLMAI